MNNKKKILIGLSVIILIIVLVVVALLLENNKKEDMISNTISRVKYEVSEEKKKFIENENLKITVNNMALVDEYLIIEYDVNIKEKAKEYFSILETIDNDFEYKISRNLIINGEVISEYYDLTTQISYKVSDNEAKVYDLINVSDIELEKEFELDVEFIDNIEEIISVDVEDDSESEEAVEDEVNPDLIELAEEYEEFDVDEETLEEFSGEDEKDFDNLEQDDDSAELIDENQEEENEEIEDFEEKDENESVKIVAGILKFSVNKDEITEGTVVEELENVNSNDGDFYITGKKVLKTAFRSFVIFESEINNVSYDGDNIVNNPDLFGIDAKNISVLQNYEMYINDEVMSVSMYNDEYNGAKACVRTIVMLNDDSKIGEMEFQPYIYNLQEIEEDGEIIEDFEKKNIGSAIYIDVK